MEISTDIVKELRDKTGVSVMQCKKALVEAGGDIEKALILLRKKGSAIAEKKSDRVLGAGVVAAYVHSTKQVGAMVELSCETDFVSKNADFAALAYELALQVAATAPLAIKREDVPTPEIEKATEALRGEVAGKPANLAEQILTGKVDAYFKDKVLLEQEYIKDPSRTVKNLIDEAVQKFGERIEVSEITRFSVK